MKKNYEQPQIAINRVNAGVTLTVISDIPLAPTPGASDARIITSYYYFEDEDFEEQGKY